jgi:cytochrome c nitrite reductase small subunit
MNIRGRSSRAGLAVLLGGGLALIGAAFAGVRYTSQPGFCASCHVMQPVHRGWSKGSHASTGCYDCHVDNTLTGHVMAKVNGLRQVYTHLTSQVDMDKVSAEVPSHRCARCHDMASEEKLGLRIVTAHRKHEEAKLECTVCHFTLGHSRELFAGFKHASCKECHSAAPAETPNPYLRKPPCTRP